VCEFLKHVLLKPIIPEFSRSFGVIVNKNNDVVETCGTPVPSRPENRLQKETKAFIKHAKVLLDHLTR
jgi:hypothetical protein